MYEGDFVAGVISDDGNSVVGETVTGVASHATPRSPGLRSPDLLAAFVRTVATISALLPALIGLSGLILAWSWARHRTSLACPEDSTGQAGSVVHGGWADHTYCSYPGGSTRPVYRESISWFEPLPWTAFLVVGAVVVLVGTASLIVRLWNCPGTIGSPLLRSSVLGISYLYGLMLGAGALFLFTLGTLALASAPLVALAFGIASISAGAATFVLVRPAPDIPLPNLAPILLALSAPMTVAALVFILTYL